jgi:hypothetical protein
MELLITVAFATAMLMAIAALAYVQTTVSSEQVSVDQISHEAEKLKSVADSVSAQGPPSRATVQITVPRGIENITVGSGTPPFIGREIVFTASSAGGAHNEVVKTTLYNVTGDLSNITVEGTYTVSVEAVEDCVGTGSPCAVILPLNG